VASIDAAGAGDRSESLLVPAVARISYQGERAIERRRSKVIALPTGDLA
jgi:hypothetical protein